MRNVCYDIAESYMKEFPRISDAPNTFALKLNRFFAKEGIGWQMSNEGLIDLRGGPLSSSQMSAAVTAVGEAGLDKSLQELKEAQHDLARRPEPDVTGVVQHASAALESVVRHITGSSKTLGQAAKEIDYTKYPPVLRDAVETLVSKLYGYASSDRGGGRHGSESIQVDRSDAAFFLGLVGSIIEYLMAKSG